MLLNAPGTILTPFRPGTWTRITKPPQSSIRRRCKRGVIRFAPRGSQYVGCEGAIECGKI